MARILLLATLAALPSLSAQTNPNESEFFWLGAKVRELPSEECASYGTPPETGGIDLVEVPADSDAGRAGLQAKDLIQKINDKPVKSVEGLLSAYAELGKDPLVISAMRYQTEGYLPIENATSLSVQTVSKPRSSESIQANVTSNQRTKNDPLSSLVDGTIEARYGPIFQNKSRNCIYKLELPKSRSISTITSWSFNMSDTRGAQIATIYGSNSDKDPGWDVADRSKFTPIASINTTRFNKEPFCSATLQARAGQKIGNYKWLVWKLSPINALGEYTAFQEIIVK